MFSFNRLKNLIRHDWMSVRKSYYILMAVLFMVQLINSAVFQMHSARFIVYLGMIIAFGIMAFAEYADKNRRIGALLLPATTAEKYVSQWLLSFVFITVSVMAAVSLGETLGVGLKWLSWGQWHWASWLTSVNWPSFLVGLVGLESIAFAGALFYRKNSALKTWATVAGYSIVMFFVMISIIFFKFNHFVEENDGSLSFGFGTDEYANQFVLYIDSVDVGMWWGTATAITVMTLVVAAFLQVWTYFRLKEEEA